ncbi:hypothetical protein SBV1_1170029 [Verrucomicrobia bacterium]|nr:hypothetical protein SBV1_1170029 [Verrucomicrobiota bacterium]
MILSLAARRSLRPPGAECPQPAVGRGDRQPAFDDWFTDAETTAGLFRISSFGFPSDFVLRISFGFRHSSFVIQNSNGLADAPRLDLFAPRFELQGL